MLTCRSSFPEKAYISHKRSLLIDISKESFLDSFELMYDSVSNTKLIDFQYRLLHNIITTNIQLVQYGHRNNDLCSFCNLNQETTIHLFLTCPYSDRIWKELYEFIARYSGTHITLKKSEIMLGLREKPFTCFYNTICTITKQYIYASRCKNTRPIFSVLIEKIKFEKHVEKLLAIKTNKFDKWQKKWELLSHLNFEI